MKACPFCGSENAAVWDLSTKLDPAWHVGCRDCGGSGGVGVNEEKARELWERRTAADFASKQKRPVVSRAKKP